MRKYKVYKHTTPNGKVYIGITSQTVEKRWQNGEHYSKQIFYRAIKKYGWDNIKHEVLYDGLEEAQAKLMEQSLIHYYKSNDANYGYNFTNGGEGSTGQNWWIGKHHTQESKIKMSNSRKGKKFSDSTKSKMSEKHSKPIIVYLISGEVFKEYDSIKNASIDLNIGSTTISNCLNGLLKTFKNKKYYAKYKEAA